MKVVFATPSLKGPTAPYIAALEQSVPLIIAAGWDEAYVQEVGNPYISAARAIMTRKALDAKADVIVYLDYDLSWSPKDLLTLIETPGDVVAGTYRFKKDEVQYMGLINCEPDGRPKTRRDGCISATRVPAGFMKITTFAIDRFMRAYPHLVFGPHFNSSVDLFNHGAHERVWFGEDYAFSRNWIAAGGELWIVPDLDITHYSESMAYPGNFHKFLMAQPQPIEAILRAAKGAQK